MMRTTVKRRLSGVLLLVAAVVALSWGHRQLAPVMRHLAYLSGWLLLAVCLFLTAYNARKKLPFLPLGNSRTWLQLHAYVGYFSLLAAAWVARPWLFSKARVTRRHHPVGV